MLALLLALAASHSVAAPPGPPLVDPTGTPAGGWWALRPMPAFDSTGQRRLGRLRALPPSTSIGLLSAVRPIIADFGSQQIDDTALFSFAEAHDPRVLYNGIVRMDLTLDVVSADLNDILVGKDDTILSFFDSAPLLPVDLGHYRMSLQTVNFNSNKPIPLFLGSSRFGPSTLKALGWDPPTDASAQPRPAAFQVLFRYYPDGSQVGALNDGEVALFQECNYRGKAFVVATDLADFAALTSSVITIDRTTASVRLANNTLAVLHDGPLYTGTRTPIKADTPCLATRGTTSLIVRPLDRNLGVLGGDCTNCKLVGANLAQADLRGMKLDGADLTNANIACANFSGSDNAHRVDLTRTTLTNVQLGTDPSCRTLFTWTTLDAETIPPSQWRYVTLAYADIRGLAGKVLSSESAPLDLTGAVLFGASLQDAILDYAEGSRERGSYRYCTAAREPALRRLKRHGAVRRGARCG